MKSLLILLLLLSLGASTYVAAARINWEGSYRTLAVAVSYQELSSWGIGEGSLEELARRGIAAVAVDPFSTDQLEVVELRRGGLEPLLLFPNLSCYDADELRESLARLAELGPRLVLFQDQGQDGYTQDQVEEIADLLERNGTLVGSLEFAPAPVDEDLYRLGFRAFVRAHMIKPEELEELTVSAALARFRRAVRERNIRLVLVLPFNAPSDRNLVYLERLTTLLQQDGFQLGIPKARADFTLAPPLLAVILLGPLSLGLLALNRAWPLRLSANALLLLLGLAVIAAGICSGGRLFRLAAAWATAVLAPVAGYLLCAPRCGQARDSLTQGIAQLLSFSAIALLGGLWVGTILSDWEFFLKLEEFRGVKAALILPLVIVFSLESARCGLSRLRRLLLRRPTLGELLLLLLGAGVLAVALLRSDNLSIVPVSGLEGRVRGLLEELLYARPRFKEFLIGHPLLLLWGARRRRLGDYQIVFLALGLVGQASIVNTFAHIHTPFLLSLLRTVNGLLLGLLIGIIVWAVVRGGERLWRSGS
ncbi:MAG: DUF5693 family protein [Candidatus Acetothermia bacterium]|jgi:hypothetical protein|nr:DUF5693 family protein [Candidatus Acetothermia bacterium]MDH7504700.1 DUF5693 family protein [Candidatus Acetothermia bacterium]